MLPAAIRASTIASAAAALLLASAPTGSLGTRMTPELAAAADCACIRGSCKCGQYKNIIKQISLKYAAAANAALLPLLGMTPNTANKQHPAQFTNYVLLLHRGCHCLNLHVRSHKRPQQAPDASQFPTK
jgi:hypothetical protein